MSTLATIKAKVRRITGRPSVNQLSDADLQTYINEFLVYDFPLHCRMFYERVPYSFMLSPRLGRYPITDFKNLYMNFEEPVYVDNFQIQYAQDERSFNNMYPRYKYSTNFATGDGGPGPYAGTYTYTPIESGTCIISAALNGNILATATDVFTQNTVSTFVDETGAPIVGSNINYLTGVITGITFIGPIPLGNQITISASTYVTGRPITCLYSNNEFRFYPFPDRGYQFTIMTYKNPNALLNDASSPELNIWVEPISYGTSMKIFAENMDTENYTKALAFFDMHLELAERRTLKQLSTQRVSTIFGNMDNWPGAYYGYPYS